MITKEMIQALHKLLRFVCKNLAWDKENRCYRAGYKRYLVFDPNDNQWHKRKDFVFELSTEEYSRINIGAVHVLQGRSNIKLTLIEGEVLEKTFTHLGDILKSEEGTCVFGFWSLVYNKVEKSALTRCFQKVDFQLMYCDLDEGSIPERYRPKEVLIDRGRKRYPQIHGSNIRRR